MRDKNMLAEKLNHLNEMEQVVLEKEKELKAQEFYLRKQWEEFEENARKTKDTPKPKDKDKPRIFGSQSSVRESMSEEGELGK
jgi:hypothetical protein